MTALNIPKPGSPKPGIDRRAAWTQPESVSHRTFSGLPSCMERLRVTGATQSGTLSRPQFPFTIFFHQPCFGHHLGPRENPP